MRIGFSGRIEPALSSLEVFDGAEETVAVGRVSSTDPNALEAVLPAVGPGVYLVKWAVVGNDTHRIEGEYRFEIQ